MEYVTRRWDPHARLLGMYYLNKWNTTQDDKFTAVTVYFMSEYATEYNQSSPVFRKLLFRSSRDTDE